VEAGVPSERIIAEPNGVDTLSQVRNCVTILRELDAAGDVWIATSRYHQARCWLLFRLLGIKTSLVPALSDLPGVPLRKLLFFWVREILALPYDALVVLCMK
ncbi:MAG: YdcF family protein, partial [Methylocystis sp.]|nr:YdcF family protein [Methylocystis sp.]